MPLVILIGASGSGKTTIARAIEDRFAESVDVFFFDRIGVPSAEQMIAVYGSGAGWQRAKTVEWMAKRAQVAKTGRKVVFEGQTRLSFLADGASAAGALAYLPILLDCNDETRSKRLTIDRGQPELANEDVINWARYLRREAKDNGCEVLDTSLLSLDEAVSYVMTRLSD
ncbi:AAA family ATPase [Ensifer aridi]|uniref:AAA family ATPase n=1 Tax=Ensifer aridi TaxID=1708715 RepID=UPI000A11C179|nr:AAA family ATPase [Ensifer aridi]